MSKVDALLRYLEDPGRLTAEREAQLFARASRELALPQAPDVVEDLDDCPPLESVPGLVTSGLRPEREQALLDRALRELAVGSRGIDTDPSTMIASEVRPRARTRWNALRAFGDALTRRFRVELRFLARLIDLGLVAATMWLAGMLLGEPWTNANSVAVVVGGLLFYLAGYATGLYKWTRESSRVEIRSVWMAWLVAFLMLLCLAFATKTSADYSRRVTVGWAILAPLGVTVWRMLLDILVHEARARGFNARNTAIVGRGGLGRMMAERIERSPWMGLRLAGFYDDSYDACYDDWFYRCNVDGDSRQALRGGFDELVAAARTGEVDLIYIALPPLASPRTAELIRELSETTASVHMAYDFGGFDLLRGDWSVMPWAENPFYAADGLLKRIEDIVLGVIILALIAIPMLLVAIGVKLTSPGPVFFRQRRYGLHGEEVRVLKFRTMTVCEDGPMVKQATKSDRRITSFGAFLRRTSLDDLPQFLQVISGTMSIVGPRPHTVAHNEEYRALLPRYMQRHKVKPGITGWAQVNGWRGETDALNKMEKRVEYDLDYIRKWGLAFDLQIIAMTVRQVLGKEVLSDLGVSAK